MKNTIRQLKRTAGRACNAIPAAACAGSLNLVARFATLCGKEIAHGYRG